jgi:hypothetical protein
MLGRERLTASHPHPFGLSLSKPGRCCLTPALQQAQGARPQGRLRR